MWSSDARDATVAEVVPGIGRLYSGRVVVLGLGGREPRTRRSVTLSGSTLLFTVYLVIGILLWSGSRGVTWWDGRGEP